MKIVSKFFLGPCTTKFRLGEQFSLNTMSVVVVIVGATFESCSIDDDGGGIGEGGAGDGHDTFGPRLVRTAPPVCITISIYMASYRTTKTLRLDYVPVTTVGEIR